MNTCHHCLSTNVIKKGFAASGKQRCLCKVCKRTFVVGGNDWHIGQAKREIIDRLLLERLSLRGICRAVQVSIRWLMGYIKEKYGQMPEDLNFSASLKNVGKDDTVSLELIDCQADELWSFVHNKENKQYVWIAMHTGSRQVIAFHVGDRSRASARELWEKIPKWVRDNGLFHTDDWDSYKTVIPEVRHEYSKRKKFTNHLERLNNTLRQRVSRLVRKSLAFSKKMENHIGALTYFFCHYNLEKQKFALGT